MHLDTAERWLREMLHTAVRIVREEWGFFVPAPIALSFALINFTHDWWPTQFAAIPGLAWLGDQISRPNVWFWISCAAVLSLLGSLDWARREIARETPAVEMEVYPVSPLARGGNAILYLTVRNSGTKPLEECRVRALNIDDPSFTTGMWRDMHKGFEANIPWVAPDDPSHPEVRTIHTDAQAVLGTSVIGNSWSFSGSTLALHKDSEYEFDIEVTARGVRHATKRFRVKFYDGYARREPDGSITLFSVDPNFQVSEVSPAAAQGNGATTP